MKFGLHFLMQCSDNQRATQRYVETIEQAVYGETLGFESVWPVEHHFDSAVSVMPCPTLLLSAIASRTRTLRLGTGIVQLPLSHPVRVAEEAATLDVLSGGRVELGVGRGSNAAHYEGFGVNMAQSRERFDEGLALLRRALAGDSCAFEGRHFRSADLVLSPLPVQYPHPAIRIAANSIETMEYAGRLGAPVLVAAHVHGLSRLKALLDVYHRARSAARHTRATPDDVSIVMPIFVGPSREQVEREVSATVLRYTELTARLLRPLVERCQDDVERERLRGILAHMKSTTVRSVNESMGVFDTPRACVNRLDEIHDELGVGRVIAWFDMGGLIPHFRVVRSMELFAAEVAPYFRDRRPDSVTPPVTMRQPGLRRAGSAASPACEE